MGLGDDELVNPAAISLTLRCAICTEVYVDPVFSAGRPCQHVFCRSCIERALQRKKQCPTCRAPMRQTCFQPHQAIGSLLDELQVRCPAGCGWTGRQDARQAHLAVCPSKMLEAVREKLLMRGLEVLQRDYQIKILKAEVATLNEDLKKSSAQIRTQDLQLGELRGQVYEKDAQISALQWQLGLTRHGDTAARLHELQAKAAANVAELAKAAAAAASRHATTMETCAKMARREADQVVSRYHQKELQIFVRELAGRTRVLKVAAYDTIHSIKLKIEGNTGIPCNFFYLTHAGKNLDDNHLALDYNISRDSTVTMLSRLPSMCRHREDGPAAKRRRSSRV